MPEKVKLPRPKRSYGDPKAETRSVVRQQLISPASYEDRDTGRTRQTEVINSTTGRPELVDLPVIERFHKPAEYRQVVEDRPVWTVEQDDGQVHEFANQADADDFVKSAREQQR